MTALPSSASRACVEVELGAARAWAERHGWTLDWNAEDLLLRLGQSHPATGESVELIGHTDGYRAIPPKWQFVRTGSLEAARSAFPAAGPSTLGSLFHPNALICAPWNRLAYSVNGGPHDNWSGPEAWLQVNEGTVAHSIPDMLAIIDAHLRLSPGFIA